MYCPKCGNQLTESDVFCPKCGYRVQTKEPWYNGKGFWWLVAAIIIVIVVALAWFIHSENQKNTTTTTTSASSSVSSSATSTSSRSQATSSASSSSQSTKEITVDDKTVGVFLALLYFPDTFKEYVSQGVMQYGSSDNGFSYISTGGDPTGWIYYKVSGDTVTYKHVDTSDSSKPVAEMPMVTETISLSRLEKDYYVSQAQQAEVNGYVKEVQDK